MPVDKELLSEMVSVSLTPEQLVAVEATAKKRDRKVSNFLRWVVVNYLKSIGALPSNEVVDADEE